MQRRHGLRYDRNGERDGQQNPQYRRTGTPAGIAGASCPEHLDNVKM